MTGQEKLKVLDGSAVISECGRYRYRLTRQVGPEIKECVFIMLNPSTADADVDDPTIRRCMGFARAWGCGKLTVVNLFAVRATDPRDMMRADDPVGPENHHYLTAAADSATSAFEAFGEEQRGPVVCAWGAHGSYMDQGETVLGWLEEQGIPAQTLRLTKKGFPGHPLYMPANLTPKLLSTIQEK